MNDLRRKRQSLLLKIAADREKFSEQLKSKPPTGQTAARRHALSPRHIVTWGALAILLIPGPRRLALSILRRGGLSVVAVLRTQGALSLLIKLIHRVLDTLPIKPSAK